jgi:hypothetical protein
MKDMLSVLIRKIVNLPLEMLGVLCDLSDKLSGEAGQEWFAELEIFLRKENCWTGVVAKPILRLISGDYSLTIDAVDGTESLADAKDVFTGLIDPEFKNCGADEIGNPTTETPVDVHEDIKDATFSQMFGELNTDVRKLCFTQAQIKNFVKKHRNWLRADGYATFFLFESKGNFFVASVAFDSDGELFVIRRQLDDPGIWAAGYRRRVVAPRLA